MSQTTILPRAGQFRFYGDDKKIDYIDVLHKSDLMQLNVEYQRGIFSANYYPDVAINTDFQVQVITDKTIRGERELVNGDPLNPVFVTTSYLYVTNQGTGEVLQFELVDKTSPNWEAIDRVYVATINIASVGAYKMSFSSTEEFDTGITVLRSDVFYAKDLAKEKDLVRITYFDSLNRNGGIYYSSETTRIWTPKTWYTGFIVEDKPDMEIDVFDSELGNSFNTLVTPTYKSKLTIVNIHKKYLKNLAAQLACDNLYVNEDRFNLEDWSTEDIEGTEIVNVTINLSSNDNNNYQQIS